VSVFPVVLSSPSGGGKTTIARRLLETRTDVGYSISCTTRAPRAGEVDGRDYHFWSEDQFHAARARGEFAEWALVHGRLYGTLRREVEAVLASGRNVILDIDVQGAAQLARSLEGVVLVFIIPPSAEVLISRLGNRATEDSEAFRLRLKNAAAELLEADQYDYVVVNEDLDAAVSAVEAIIAAEGLRRVRIDGLDRRIEVLVRDLQQVLEHGTPANNS
jgi:guanylate kinase